MKKSDIKVGVVYAYQESKYYAPQPVVLLDITHTYTLRSWARKPYQVPAEDASARAKSLYEEAVARADESLRQRAWVRDAKPLTARASGGYSGGNDHGYLAVGAGTYGRAEIAEFGGMDAWVRHLRGITLEQVLAVTGADSTSGHLGVTPVRVINPRFLVGEWASVSEERQAAQELAQDLARIAKEESDARVAAATERVEALRALALPGEIATPVERTGYGSASTQWSGNTGSVVLSLVQIDALLSLIPEGTVYVAPSDTEADGWTLRKPEYDGGDA